MIGYFFPLQALTNFSLDTQTASVTDIIIGIGIVGLLIGGIIILNSVKGKSSAGKSGGGGGGGGGGLLSFFALQRAIKNLGLNHEQKKMLSFVLKNDYAANPEQSINSPALLDRHFRKAYRLIEKSSGSDNEAQHRLAVLFSTRNILENSSLGGINSTLQIKEDTPLNITYGKDKIAVHVMSAKGDHLLVDAPKTVLGSPVKIDKGSKLNVLFFNKNHKGFSFETRIIGYTTKGGQQAMQLAHTNQLRFLSQRRFRRKHAHIASSLYLVYVEGSGKKQRMIVDKRLIKGNIADISVGGCSIKTMVPVQVGARFKIEFLQGDTNIAALGQVLRSNRAGINTIIHVRFLKVSQKSMNIINAFVYEYSKE